jgi:hypothetical protein
MQKHVLDNTDNTVCWCTFARACYARAASHEIYGRGAQSRSLLLATEKIWFKVMSNELLW